jgi:hypothetical protein
MRFKTLTKGWALYQVFTFIFIVIVLSAMFTLQLWTELEDKHCRYCYDYDKENLIQLT